MRLRPLLWPQGISLSAAAHSWVGEGEEVGRDATVALGQGPPRQQCVTLTFWLLL